VGREAAGRIEQPRDSFWKPSAWISVCKPVRGDERYDGRVFAFNRYFGECRGSTPVLIRGSGREEWGSSLKCSLNRRGGRRGGGGEGS
jgi:hypothetical protein